MNTELWGRFDMLPRGARVLCAVSGGADSICLLHLLKSLEAERGITVIAAHYEHGLRGEESLRDMAFVEDWCRERDIPCVTERGDVRAYAAEKRLGLEEAAREKRYDFLERTADELGCGRIATAHSADDMAETLLMNLIRGSGLKGLSGIPPRRGRIVRPLLETSRAEIERYLAEQGLSHVEDGSNADESFLRNRLRRQVMPLLREMNPAVDAALGRTAELLRRDEAYLESLAAAWLEENRADGSLPAPALAGLPPALASRVLRLYTGKKLSMAHTDAAIRFASGAEPGWLELPGLRLRRERGRLSLGGEEEESAPEFAPRRIEAGSVTELPELGLRIIAEEGLCGDEEIHIQFNTFCLGYEKMNGDVTVTPRRPGDRIRPAGRGVGKSLKSLFEEADMTLARRRRALVFRDSEGVLAVFPLAVDERCAPAPGKRVLHIRVERTE